MPNSITDPDHAEEQWTSYKLWIGDLWLCRGCGTEIIVGVPSHHISEHFHPDYEKQCKRYNPVFRIDDC